MKKRLLSILLLLCFFIGSAFVWIKINDKQKNKTGVPELLSRNDALVYEKDWETVKSNHSILIHKTEKNPNDLRSLNKLISLYITEARVTGQFKHYNLLALSTIERVLAIDPHNFEALSFRATILLSQHRFEEALAIAEPLSKKYPHNAYVQGLLVDGYIEMGYYQKALESASKMISIRPDLRSYSRIAYLREIHGDIPGSIEAMQMAVDAGSTGDENTEWCRIHLGKLNEKLGQIEKAKHHYEYALSNRPNYPYAIAGLARLMVAEKKYDDALRLYKQADSMIPDHFIKEGITEVYELTDRDSEAKKSIKDNLTFLLQQTTNTNENTGQNEDLELAHAYAANGDLMRALQHISKEYKRRPDNIEVSATMAMVLEMKNDNIKALDYMLKALKTGSKDPELLCQAGLLYSKLGDREKTKYYLNQALQNNPLLPLTIEQEARKILAASM